MIEAPHYNRRALVAAGLVLAAGFLGVRSQHRQRAANLERETSTAARACSAAVELALADLGGATGVGAAAYLYGGQAAWQHRAEAWVEANPEGRALLVAADGGAVAAIGALERLTQGPPVGGLTSGPDATAVGSWRTPDGRRLAVTVESVFGAGEGAYTPAWSALALPMDLLLATPECADAAARTERLELALDGFGSEAPGLTFDPAGAEARREVGVELAQGTGRLVMAIPEPGWPWSSMLFVGVIGLVVAAATRAWTSPSRRLQDELEARRRQLEQANASWLQETERRRQVERKVELWESRDALTRLSSRSDLLRRLNEGLERARANTDFGLAVVYIGIDRFKDINASLGHGGGDKVLAELGGRLLSAARSEGTPARIGGDCFAVALFDIDAAERAALAGERMRKALCEPLSVDGHELFPSVSVGIFVSHLGLERADGALLKAEIAMNEAKTAGGDRVVLFEPSMAGGGGSRLQLESDLRRAVTAGEFEAHYQPVIALDSKRLVGLETLLRWRHPTDGLIMPDNFIPLAEETGLIVSLTQWVLAEGFRQLSEWQSHDSGLRDLYLTVNLSAKDLDEPYLPGYVKELLAANNLPPGAIRVEVTESSLMRDLDKAAARLEELHRMKVPLLLDDFGTGYSSLSYLHKLPFDFVKIDRSFVQPLSLPEGDREVVRAIVDLTHCFGMQSIAEGVETANDVSILRGLGCEYGQGYLYSRPLPPGQALPFLLANRR